VIRTIPLWGQQEISQVSDEPLFENFKPSPPPASGGQAGDPPHDPTKRTRGGAPKKGRKKREPQSVPAQQVAAVEQQNASRPRRPRKQAPAAEAPTGRRKKRGPQTVKLDIGSAITALAGLTPDDAAVVQIIAARLQTLAKKSRARIVGALGKLFG
jgi:hypothetical protein